MSSYIIDVKNTSGEEGTVIADVGFSYSENLNELNEAQLKISGTGATRRGLFEVGSEVKIYRNTILSFHGIINGISYLDGGGISADVLGFEFWLAKENGAYAGSPWSSTASATIASTIIAESNYFTAGTINAGANIDFRSEVTDSLYNALQRLIKRVGQDIGIDYANSEVDILDHKGSSSSVMALNDGVQIRDMVVRQSYPIGNDVRVFGKSEGQTRIKSNPATSGQDASSKSTYGTIRKDYIDNSVVTQAEANAMADILVARWKDPVKVYEFDVMNPNQNLVCGDVITLSSSTKGLSAEEVRIVSIKRGVESSREFMILEVTNKAYSTKTRNINQKIAELENQSKNLQTYDSFEEEYTNQNSVTCVGGIMGAGGSTVQLDSGCIFAADAINIGASSNFNYIGANIVTGCGLVLKNLEAPAFDSDAATKKYVDDNTGGSSFWVDGTNPYIVSCNSCGLCVAGNIISSSGTNCLGLASDPQAWKEIWGNCITAALWIETTCSCASRKLRVPVGTNCY